MKQNQAQQDQMKHDMGQDQTKKDDMSKDEMKSKPRLLRQRCVERGRRQARIRGACHSQTKRGKP